jgi:WD40 repeat protein
MSATANPDLLLQTRGVSQQLGAYVVAAAFARGGGACAFGLGDGSVHVAPRAGGGWRSVVAHDGAVLALAAGPGAAEFLSGGDDGRLCRVGEAVAEVAAFGSKWVEHVAGFADAKTRLLACAVGRQVHLFDGNGTKLKSLDHPSSVTGLVFDAKGKRIGASHYNGASLWFVAAKADNARKLEWKGSHTGIAISPDGDNVVTAMQDNALHGWRLTDGGHMRMTGYPGKTRALNFSRTGRWLATSGADAIVLWPFFGGGPTGKAPTELAGGDGVVCTLVAANPQQEVVAAGFADGLVVLADIATARIVPVCGAGRGPISALAWSADGAFLAFGTETGFAALVDLSQK